MKPCACREVHPLKRVVLTGGPGAGKTAVLEVVRKSVCEHVVVLSESAGIVFGGGFPRTASEPVRRAAQRAIFFVQRELEAAAESANPAIILCDRGTVDGAAYWPGPDTLWSSVGVAHADELARYDAVIHLRTPTAAQGYQGARGSGLPSTGRAGLGSYDRVNPLRLETAEDAVRIDQRIALEWDGHPRVFVVEATEDFVVKARLALDLIRAELPACCRAHPVQLPARPASPTHERRPEVHA